MWWIPRPNEFLIRFNVYFMLNTLLYCIRSVIFNCTLQFASFVTALGKNWHVEHFACAKCEKPFFGHRHYERNGLAYCANHYHQLFGELCYRCDGVIQGDVLQHLTRHGVPAISLVLLVIFFLGQKLSFLRWTWNLCAKSVMINIQEIIAWS